MEKSIIIAIIIWMITLTTIPAMAKKTEDVFIKGVDDGVKQSEQRDYSEAVMDAQLQAIKSAGLDVESIINIDDFEQKSKTIDSIAKSILLPDFKIFDMGYRVDGIYQVVLSGRVKTANAGKTPLDIRIEQEKKAYKSFFFLTPHKLNYLLPITYITSSNESAENVNEDYNRMEVKFQLSLKACIWKNIFEDNGYLFCAYTQRSFWQAYDFDNSSPFRETNYEPELMLTFLNDYDLYVAKNRIITIGLNHQSNGKSGTTSRSWNRVYADFIFERGNFYLEIKPWVRIHEGKDSDNNPDIDKYLGYGELMAMYNINDHTVSLMLRNNLRLHNRGAIQLDWSFPLIDEMKGYVQFFNGYGESLIDYNRSVNSFGIGVIISDWL